MKPEAKPCALAMEPGLGACVAGLIRGLLTTHGLDLGAYDETFLAQSLTQHALAGEYPSSAEFATFLLDEPAAAAAFSNALRITYSEFFRNPLTFALLEQRVLPALIAEKKSAEPGEIRIWSAGCGSGQEAWSLAMLADELTRAEDRPLAYRIFASDVLDQELELARAGVYPAEALGNVRQRHLRGCFCAHGESFAIVSRLRSQVDFSAYDLLDLESSSPEAAIYGDFDLILCCNLLFYYRPAIQQRLLAKLLRALAPGGYCVTGEAEREILAKHPGLRAVTPSAPVFQKETARPGSNTNFPVAGGLSG